MLAILVKLKEYTIMEFFIVVALCMVGYYALMIHLKDRWDK